MFGGLCIFSLRMPICFLPSDIGTLERRLLHRGSKESNAGLFLEGIRRTNPEDGVVLVLRSITVHLYLEPQEQARREAKQARTVDGKVGFVIT